MHIGDDDIEVCTLDEFAGFLTRGSRLDVPAHSVQVILEESRDHWIIFYHEDFHLSVTLVFGFMAFTVLFETLSQIGHYIEIPCRV